MSNPTDTSGIDEMGIWLSVRDPHISITEWLAHQKKPRVDTLNAVAKRIASLLLRYRGSESPRTQSAIISKLLAETFGTKLSTLVM